MIVLTAVFVASVAAALLGSALTLLAARALQRLAAAEPAGEPVTPATVLRPLHGVAPGLAENLRASLDQAHGAPFTVRAVVHDPDDPAAPIARAVLGEVLADPALHGPNRKASQLQNLAARVPGGVLVAVDDDIRPGPGWLTAVTAPLADPAVGLVTCLYRGVPADAAVWSRLAAFGIDWQFLPFAALGERMGRAQGCYGATVALRADILARIGGFRAVAGVLADDHALGAAVRRLGLRVVVAPNLPAHVMAESSLASLFAHELRWARTVRLLDPAGAFGAGLTHPLAWGALAAVLSPGWVGFGALAAALAARVVLVRVVARALGPPPGPAGPVGPLATLALLPARDALSFAVWLTGLARGSVTWQGRRYRMTRDGAMVEVGGSARERLPSAATLGGTTRP